MKSGLLLKKHNKSVALGVLAGTFNIALDELVLSSV